jgi:hypothetical protein
MELRAAFTLHLAQRDRDAVVGRREACLQGIGTAFMPEPQLSIWRGGCALLVDKAMLAQACPSAFQDTLGTSWVALPSERLGKVDVDLVRFVASYCEKCQRRSCQAHHESPSIHGRSIGLFWRPDNTEISCKGRGGR